MARSHVVQLEGMRAEGLSGSDPHLPEVRNGASPAV